jgi:P27 family predicted phage terminase small subunit
LVDDKAALTVTASAPPASLGKTGSNLWRTVMNEYDIRDSGGRQMLQQICEAADRIREFAAIIKRDGPVIRTKNGPKDHPLLKHELSARAFVVRSLHRLGLDVEPIRTVGRPTQNLGWIDHADE